jgi:hypothetical protein
MGDIARPDVSGCGQRSHVENGPEPRICHLKEVIAMTL